MIASLRSLLSASAASGSLGADPLRVLSCATLGALLWLFHVLRLRSRERRLLAVIERMVHPPGLEAVKCQSTRDERIEPPDASPASSLADARVLVVAGSEDREALVHRLESMGVSTTSADTTWSARVACREAFEAGGPYNLVLLHAAVCEADAEAVAGFEAQLAGGVRVAVVRGPASVDAAAKEARDAGAGWDDWTAAPAADGWPPDWLEESVGPHEDPDRRGRGGFAAAVAADASALGLRGPRRE